MKSPMAGADVKTVKFMEELPPSCPPPGAGSFAYATVYRFVASKPVTDEDFASHQAMEQKTGKGRRRCVPPCISAATSLFVTRDSAYVALPKPRERFSFLAHVKITKQCGVSILKRSHISFWRYATYKPSVHGYESL
jgi:hypothetical protein